MKYFRSPELAFWAAVVAVLAALTVFAVSLGGEPAPGGRSEVAIGAPAASASQARPQVDALLSLMPSGIAAGTDPAALKSFAAAVDAQAQQGAAVRAGEGAAAGDPMLTGFTRTAEDARRLTGRAGNPVAATALRTQIGLDVSQLQRLVLGQPAPEPPAAGLDPFAGTGDLTSPNPPIPNRPSTPAVGAKP